MTDVAPMKFIALVSGGKDSIFNIHKCVAQGHTLVAIANLYPADIGMEKDSYMYQSVGTNMIDAIGECLGVPVIRRSKINQTNRQLKGKPVVLDLEYTGSKEEKSQDEVEDLYEILREAKEKWDFVGVSSGAIASTYQKLRVEDVCKRLGLVSLAYLWGRDQQELLKEMVDQGMNSILIKVASYGLGREHLGLSLRDNYDKIVALNAKFHLNVCGEGGEYESLTLDSPLYKKRIVIKESDVLVHSEDEYAPVYYLFIKSYELQDK